MLANLMLMKEKPEDAINIYIQLLDKKPDNFNALAQLIELLRRAGRMADVPKFLEKAERAAARSSMAGLSFTKGLYLGLIAFFPVLFMQFGIVFFPLFRTFLS
jgi:tetratricopeptide repeat protein 21B